MSFQGDNGIASLAIVRLGQARWFAPPGWGAFGLDSDWLLKSPLPACLTSHLEFVSNMDAEPGAVVAAVVRRAICCVGVGDDLGAGGDEFRRARGHGHRHAHHAVLHRHRQFARRVRDWPRARFGRGCDGQFHRQ